MGKIGPDFGNAYDALKAAFVATGADGSAPEWWERFSEPEVARTALDCLRASRETAPATFRAAAANWLMLTSDRFQTACDHIRGHEDLGYVARMLSVALPIRLGQLGRGGATGGGEPQSAPEPDSPAEVAHVSRPGEFLTVVRNPGDWREIDVPVSELSDFHMRAESGGVNKVSPTPLLYARMWCTSIPEGAEFGHSCKHGPPPHEILVCITQKANTGPLYKEIRKRVDPGWGERKGPRVPNPFPSRTCTFKVGRYGTRTVTVVSGREYEVKPLAPNKLKHRGRRCTVIDDAGEKVEVKFTDNGRLGCVDTRDLWADGLTRDSKSAKED